MVGVLKAGGCYLPLDPSHPAARLSLMLGDAGASLVLTTQALSARLPRLATLYLDDAWELAQQASLSAAAVSDGERCGSLLAEHLAYIIYTSGSTGTPKGGDGRAERGGVGGAARPGCAPVVAATRGRARGRGRVIPKHNRPFRGTSRT